MANEGQVPGLLSQFGLDLNEKDLRDANLRQKQVDILGLLRGQQGSPGFNPGMAQAGGMLGAALAGRKFQPSDDEQARIATAKAAQMGMENWIKENPEAKTEDKQYKYQEILATSAFTNGLPDVGSSILVQLDEQRMKRQKQATELKKLGIETEVAEKTKDYDIALAAINSGKAAHVEAYQIGSRDPNATISGVFNPKTGGLITKNGELPAGTWKITRPDRDPVITDTSKGIGKYGVAEQNKLRENVTAVQDLVDKTLSMDKLFTEAYNNGNNVAGMMADVGKIESFTNRLVNTGIDLARALSPDEKGSLGAVTLKHEGTTRWGNKDYNLDSASSRKQYMMDNIDTVKQYLPPNLAQDAEYADRYSSMLVDMAYSVARAAEPGAKALTDADFEHAMSQIGGALNDPTTLRKILMERANRAARSLDNRFQNYSTDDIDAIVNPRARVRLTASMGELEDRLGFDTETGATTGASYPAGNRRPGRPGYPAAAPQGVTPNTPYGAPPAGGGPPPGLTPDAFRAWKQAHPDWKF